MLPFVPSVEEIEQALLILLRVSALIALVPVLGHQVVPSQVKAGLSLLIAMLIYPVVVPYVPPVPASPVLLGVMALQELLIAGMIALLANLIFAAVQFAGQMLSMQMGMAIANVFDPATA